MIHRIVLFLKFAPVFGRLIVPLWNRKKHKTSVDGQTSQKSVDLNALKEPNFYYRRFEPEGSRCPGLGRGFFVLCVNANFMKLQRCVVIRIATVLKHNPKPLLIQEYLAD